MKIQKKIFFWGVGGSGRGGRGVASGLGSGWMLTEKKSFCEN